MTTKVALRRCPLCNSYLRGACKPLASDNPRHERFEATCKQGHVVRITVCKIAEKEEKGA